MENLVLLFVEGDRLFIWKCCRWRFEEYLPVSQMSATWASGGAFFPSMYCRFMSSAVILFGRLSSSVILVQLSKSNLDMVSISASWKSPLNMSSAAPVVALQFNTVFNGGVVNGVLSALACPK